MEFTYLIFVIQTQKATDAWSRLNTLTDIVFCLIRFTKNILFVVSNLR
jgi:hypothetical protein